jgi:hypothetical protein
VSYSQAGVLAPCEALKGKREEIGVDDAAMLRSVEPHFFGGGELPNRYDSVSESDFRQAGSRPT